MTDLRAAAERLRRLIFFGGSESVTEVYHKGDGSHDQHLDDQDAVIDAYLATIRPDDGVNYNDDWLLSVGFNRYGGGFAIYPKTSRPKFSLCITQLGDCELESGECVVEVPIPTTRGRLRQLCSALGIELRESH